MKHEMQALLQWVEQGSIRPCAGVTLSLADAAEGHRLVESGESIGKIALRVE